MDAIILYDSSLVRISCFLITVGSCFLLASVVTKQHFASPVHCWCICPSCQHLCNIIWLWELEEASFHRQKGIASVRAWFQLLFLGAASSFQNDCAMASGRQDLIKTRKSTGLHEMWKCLVVQDFQANTFTILGPLSTTYVSCKIVFFFNLPTC